MVIAYRPLYAKHHTLEPPKNPNDNRREAYKDCPLDLIVQAPGGEDEVVDHVAGHKNGEPQRRKVVMEVCHPAHDQEW